MEGGKSDQKAFQIRLSLKGNIPRLKSIQNAKTNHVVTIAPLMTLRELHDLCHELFGVPNSSSKPNDKNVMTNTKGSSSSKSKSKGRAKVQYELELWVGFPPKRIDTDSAGSGLTFVTANGIQSGDSVTVKIEKKTASKKSVATGNEVATTSTTATKIATGGKASSGRKRQRPSPASAPTSASTDKNVAHACTNDENDVDIVEERPRAKRAAAKAASDSFKDVIRAQNKIILNEKKNHKSSSKAKPAAAARITTGPTAAQIAARKRAAEARASAATSRKFASLSGGRRLNGSDDGDKDNHGEVTTVRKNGKKQAAPSSIFSGLKSEDDISFALLSSIDASGGRGGGSSKNGKVSKVLRSAMRKTVEKSYEASRAVVRCSAIGSRKITFTPYAASSQEGYANNTMGTYTVKYPKGIEGVGFYEEQIHIITIEMLRAVVESVHADHNSDDDEGGSDGQSSSGREMLKPANMALLSPRVFWSLWFHFHNNVISVENQQPCSSIEEALELLLPNLDWSFLHQRSRKLSEKARENLRQKQKQGKQDGTTSAIDQEAGVRAVKAVEKAMEQMYDETVTIARERAANAALARFEQTNDDTKMWTVDTPSESDEDELEECITECIDSLTDEELDKCVKNLISKLTINNWRMLANCVADELQGQLKDDCGIDVLTIENVEACIGAAQTRSIEEIMLEILDGNEDLYLVLNEKASCGTPKDLSLFVNAPDLLLKEVSSTSGVAHNPPLTEADIKKYCERASIAVNSLKWLNDYTTSIVG